MWMVRRLRNYCYTEGSTIHESIVVELQPQQVTQLDLFHVIHDIFIIQQAVVGIVSRLLWFTNWHQNTVEVDVGFWWRKHLAQTLCRVLSLRQVVSIVVCLEFVTRRSNSHLAQQHQSFWIVPVRKTIIC